MPDLTPFIAQWGYAAIFVIVILGNVGLPVPEETVLTVSGYLIWQGRRDVFNLTEGVCAWRGAMEFGKPEGA